MYLTTVVVQKATSSLNWDIARLKLLISLTVEKSLIHVKNSECVELNIWVRCLK